MICTLQVNGSEGFVVGNVMNYITDYGEEGEHLKGKTDLSFASSP